MYGESNMKTYIIIGKIDSQWEFALCSGNSNRGSVTTQRAVMGGRWEGGSRGRGYMYTYG